MSKWRGLRELEELCGMLGARLEAHDQAPAAGVVGVLDELVEPAGLVARKTAKYARDTQQRAKK